MKHAPSAIDTGKQGFVLASFLVFWAAVDGFSEEFGGMRFGGGIGANGDVISPQGNVFGSRDFESGAMTLNRHKEEGKTNAANAVFGAKATESAARFCKSEGRPGTAIGRCAFGTVEEARSVAFLLLSDRIGSNPDIEWSTGVEKDSDGLYHPLVPIGGKKDSVTLPSQKGVVENMHYHPQSEKALASLLDFAAANGEGIPGFIVTGQNGLTDVNVLRYDANGTYSRYSWNDGIVEPVPGSEPRMLSELCSPTARQTYDEVVKNFSPDVLNGTTGHIQACPETTVATGTFQPHRSVPEVIGRVVPHPSLESMGVNGGNVSGTVESGVSVPTGGTIPTAAAVPAQAYETIDYRELKRWGTDLLNNTYSQVSAMADEEGFGAEYRSRAAPVLNQGLNYLQSIPDEVQVPAGQ